MKILIDNYSEFILKDNMCEAMSIYLKEIGHNVLLNNQIQMPFYRKMKEYNPDYLMTSFGCLTKDFLEYINNEKAKTIFIIFDDINYKHNKVYELEQFLLKSKVKYKLILNENHNSRHSSILNAPNNIIHFGGFQTQYLLAKKETKWEKQFDFLLLGGANSVDLNILHKLREQKFKFHNHIAYAKKSIELTKPIVSYKDILCNYKSFVFYSNEHIGLNKEFYDICALRKPVYLLSSADKKFTQKSLGVDIDIAFENRDRSNINFEEFHDHIAKEFSVKNQVDKILTHLPKVK